MTLNNNIKKVIRFYTIYGFWRTFIKILGRSKYHLPIHVFFKNPFKKNTKTIGFIGCGHHSYSSLAFFLTRYTNFSFLWSHDINKNNQLKFNKTYGIIQKHPYNDCEIPDLVYIASNHSTHTEYAIDFIQKGADIYVEKPVSTNLEQLEKLDTMIKNYSESKVFVGYNRPFSKAIKEIKKRLRNYENDPMTLNCFIIGHKISDDHWYRKSSEGTRIIGNLGHWIDLSLHLLWFKNSIPSKIEIDISYSDYNFPSENISVSMTTNNNDIISLVFSAREEPFEGVSENINLQCGNLISKINDFKLFELWEKDYYIKKRFFPKDNGHKDAALQPLNNKKIRSWTELKESTKLMLFIEEMVKSKIKNNTYIIKK